MTTINPRKPAPYSMKGALSKKLFNSKTLILMCVPAIIYFIAFSYAPLPGIYVAFVNYNYRKGIFGSPFVGLKNFDFVAKSGKLWTLTQNTILFNLAFILLDNLLAVTVAILLKEIQSKSFRKVSQTMMFLPYFISQVLVGLLVFSLLNSDTGFLNVILKSLGAEPLRLYKTGDPWPFIIILVHLWQKTGYNSVVYFAAIMGIDDSIIEASMIDGANGPAAVCPGRHCEGRLRPVLEPGRPQPHPVPEGGHHRNVRVPRHGVRLQLLHRLGCGSVSVPDRLYPGAHRERHRKEDRAGLFSVLRGWEEWQRIKTA